MKKSIIIFTLICSCFAGLAAAPKKVEVIKPEASAVTISKYDENKRSEIITWLEQLRVKVAKTEENRLLAEGNLVKSELSRKTAENELAVLRVKIQNLSDWGVAQQDARITAEAELLKVLPKYHFLKYWVSLGFAICAAGVVGLAIFKFAPQALNTAIGAAVGLGLPVAVGLIVFTFIQIRL